MSQSLAGRLQDLGLRLPQVAPPTASYVPVSRFDRLAFVSGQIALSDVGDLPVVGRLGEDVDIDQGKDAAQRCALQLLAQVDAALGSLEHIDRFLKLTVFVASTPTFNSHHLVANGASDLLESVFGDRGKHARSACGIAALPFNSPVEIEAILAITDDIAKI